jgi:hypothetical protein
LVTASAGNKWPRCTQHFYLRKMFVV